MKLILLCAVEDPAGMVVHVSEIIRADAWISCVVAGRLANLDRNLSVLLIEAGENNLNNPW